MAVVELVVVHLPLSDAAVRQVARRQYELMGKIRPWGTAGRAEAYFSTKENAGTWRASIRSLSAIGEEHVRTRSREVRPGVWKVTAVHTDVTDDDPLEPWELARTSDLNDRLSRDGRT